MNFPARALHSAAVTPQEISPLVEVLGVGAVPADELVQAGEQRVEYGWAGRVDLVELLIHFTVPLLRAHAKAMPTTPSGPLRSHQYSSAG